jgi:hypothetical protein
MTFQIIQFGDNRFRQAQVDLFVCEALDKGAIGRSVAVEASESHVSQPRLQAALASGEGAVSTLAG